MPVPVQMTAEQFDALPERKSGIRPLDPVTYAVVPMVPTLAVVLASYWREAQRQWARWKR